MAFDIDNFQIEFEASSKQAIKGVDALAASLGKLKSVVGNSTAVSVNLEKLAASMRSLASVGKLDLTANINQLNRLNDVASKFGNKAISAFSLNMSNIAVGMRVLSSVPKTNVTSIAGGLEKLNAVSAALDSERIAEFSRQMQGVAAGLSSLDGIQKGNLGSMLNQLKKIPEITKDLNPDVLNQFSDAMKRLAVAMEPLAVHMEKISNGFSMLPKRMRSVIKAADSVTSSNKRMSNSFNSVTTSLSRSITKFMVMFYATKRICDIFADAFRESNNYIENLNLFRVTMGDAADEAYAFAEKVQAAMGIDISEWIQNQGIFMQLATGFGVSSDKAELMSKNLTQLGYDMASFFNTDVETAMKKLQSGMSGEIEGLKAFGINLSVAALQEEAHRLGIEQKVRTMNEAQRAQIRYNLLMRKSQNIMGDMARTLLTPANSMRILSAQLTQLRRAFGNIVSVIATQIIPWVQAFVEIITEAATALANFFGFELPEIDYSGLDIGGGIEDNLDDATESAKELKRQLLGIDELNILEKKETGGSGGAGGAGSDWEVDLPEYDFLGGLTDRTNDLKDKLKEILKVVGYIGTALAGWKITKGVADILSDLLDVSKSAVIKKGLGITLMIVGFTMQYDGMLDIFRGKADLWDYIKAGLGAALGIAGSLLTFGTGPLGWTVGIGLTLLTTVLAWKTVERERFEDSEFYKKMQEVKAEAERSIEVTKQIIVNTETRLASLEDVQAQFDAYRDMVDEVFRLNAIQNKSNEEFELMMSYVDIINDLGLDGLRLTFDKTTGKIVETKEAIYDVIDALKQQAMHEAAYELTVEAYKSRIQAVEEYRKAQEASAAQCEVVRDIEKKLAQVTEEINAANDEYAESGIRVQGCLMGMGGASTELMEKQRDLRQQLEEAKEAQAKTTEAYINAQIAVNKVGLEIENYESILAGAARTTETNAAKMIEAFKKARAEASKLSTAVQTATFKGVSVNVSRAEAYASGGFPDEGEMFIAREAGPELVGRIGSKNAVANNDQIVAGIAAGVRGANADVVNAVLAMGNQVSGAVRSQGGNVYLDGKKVGEKTTEVQNRRNRMYGKSLQNA